MDQHFPDVPRDRASLARKLRIPRAKLDAVYARGYMSWAPGKAPPGVTAFQWAKARMFKFILIEKEKIKPDPKSPDNPLHKASIRKKVDA